MQNGTYVIKHKMLNTEYKLIAYNGVLKVYSMAGKFFRTYRDDTHLNEMMTIVEKVKGTPKMYDIAWIVNGKIKEVLVVNRPFATCLSKIDTLRAVYTYGLLRPKMSA